MENEFKNRVIDVEIKEEMETSYINYAMSVGEWAAACGP